jgi:hypothetical protein
MRVQPQAIRHRHGTPGQKAPDLDSSYSRSRRQLLRIALWARITIVPLSDRRLSTLQDKDYLPLKVIK